MPGPDLVLIDGTTITNLDTLAQAFELEDLPTPLFAVISGIPVKLSLTEDGLVSCSVSVCSGGVLDPIVELHMYEYFPGERYFEVEGAYTCEELDVPLDRYFGFDWVFETQVNADYFVNAQYCWDV